MDFLKEHSVVITAICAVVTVLLTISLAFMRSYTNTIREMRDDFRYWTRFTDENIQRLDDRVHKNTRESLKQHIDHIAKWHFHRRKQTTDEVKPNPFE